MNHVLDIVLLCILLLFTAIGVRRGFIRSAAHFVGGLVAAALSSMLGGTVAKWAFDSMFRPALVEKIGESINSLGAGDLSAAVTNLFSSLPDFLVRALESAGVSAGVLQGTLATKTGQAAELMTDALAPVFINFLKVLAVIVLFLLFMMLVRVLADMLATAFHLPILKQINSLLGGAFGFLMALLSIWIVVAAIQVFTPMLAAKTQQELQQVLNSSWIAGFLVKLNPMTMMFK